MNTYKHPEGINGVQETAAVFLARTCGSNKMIRTYLEDSYQYRLDESVEQIRKYYRSGPTCPGSVPRTITAFHWKELNFGFFLDSSIVLNI